MAFGILSVPITSHIDFANYAAHHCEEMGLEFSVVSRGAVVAVLGS